MELLEKSLHVLSLAVALAGGVVVVWGVLVTLIEFMALERRRLRGENICVPREYLRHHFGSYLLLALEFLIAADVLSTILKPSIQELIILGSIVVIRSILDFFLSRSLQHHECRRREHGE
jgi:uncharacterized membrane protein